MKILIVTQYFWPENFRVNDLAKGLRDAGHDVTVFTGLPNYPQGKIYKGYSFWKGPFSDVYDGIKVLRIPLVPRGTKKGIQLILNYFSFFIFGCLLIPFMCRQKYDHVFVYEVSPVTVALPAIILKWIKKVPVSMWVTDLWPDTLEATGVVKNKKLLFCVGLLVKFIYKNLDHILVSSRAFIPKINAFYKHKNEIIYWPQWAEDLYLGDSLDQNTLKSVNDELPQGFRILFAGNLGTSQGLDSLIEVANKMKVHPNVQWIVLGDGLVRKSLEKSVKEYNLSNFHIMGRRDLEQMPYYYKNSDALLVSLKKSELFSITVPSKLQSCLASGKPILGAIDGETARIIKESGAGFVSGAGDVKGLADNALHLSTLDESELSAHGENAKKIF